jgi:hypothetical protein
MMRHVVVTAILVVLSFTATNAEKVFASGFEPGTYTVFDETEQRAKDIRGYDSTTGYDWETDLEADGRTFFMNYCDASDGSHNPDMLGSDIVQDPENPDNHVLYTWQNGAEYVNWWSRVQAEFKNFDAPEVYYKVRFRIDGDVAVVNGEDWWVWAMLGCEVKPSIDPSGHSLSVRLHRRGTDDVLVWGYHVRTPTGGSRSVLSDEVVVFDTWQTLEFYAKAGDEGDGHVRIVVDGQTVADTAIPTVEGGGVWGKLQPLKVYGNLVDVVTDPEKGNKEAVKVWFDDMEIWDSDPNVTTIHASAKTSRRPTALSGSIAEGGRLPWYTVSGRRLGNDVPYVIQPHLSAESSTFPFAQRNGKAL